MRVKHRLSRTFANYLLSFAGGNTTLPSRFIFWRQSVLLLSRVAATKTPALGFSQ